MNQPCIIHTTILARSIILVFDNKYKIISYHFIQ